MDGLRVSLPGSALVLLARIVDYAGLFPPAALPMAPAVQNYAAYRHDPNAWMLGRFIIPAARLDEFATAADQLDDESGPWQLSALLGPEVQADLSRIASFNEAAGGRFVIDTVEARADTIGAIRAIRHAVPVALTLYLEIPLTPDPYPLIAAISDATARAKVRTGGVTATQFPPPADLVRFLSACVVLGVPFKATAGLHHPVRGSYPLTYEPDSPRAPMYGYLNVLLATALLTAGRPPAVAAAALAETDSGAIAFEPDGVRWHGESIPLETIQSVRTHLFGAFGSCAFREPVDEFVLLTPVPRHGPTPAA